MTGKEAIETIVLYIRTHHGARENGKSRICEALNTITNAFEKAEKYRWHDLRKNPDDLPTKEESEYIIAWKRAEYTDTYYEIGSWEFIEGQGYRFCHPQSEHIIAWREIESLEESYHE